MKVYFETIGCGCGKLGIKVYVNPTEDGHGYHYGTDGELYQFAWVHPKRAIVFDSSDLPEDLWYSIQHGVDHVEVEESKRNWTWDDVEYKKVSPEEVEAFTEVDRRIDNIRSIDEFKELYPLIKKSGRINRKIMNKLFSFFDDIPDIPVKNGEIGIQYYYMTCIYRSLLIKLELEKAE